MTESTEILGIFHDLLNQPRSQGTYLVEPIAKTSKILVGINLDDDFVCLLRQPTSQPRPSKVMKALRVDYALPLTASLSGEIVSETFTSLTLNNEQKHLLRVFSTVLDAFVTQLSDDPTESQLDQMIESFIELFKEKPGIPRDRIKGLFGELAVMLSSPSPEIWLKAWHESQLSKHDFSFEQASVEVKTAESYQRKHKCSASQLTRIHPEREIFLASVLIEESPLGETVFELMEKLIRQVSDNELRTKLLGLVFGTVGAFVEEAQGLKWEVLGGYSAIPVFPTGDLPLPVIPDSGKISQAFSDIRFDLNLEILQSVGISPLLVAKFHDLIK